MTATQPQTPKTDYTPIILFIVCITLGVLYTNLRVESRFSYDAAGAFLGLFIAGIGCVFWAGKNEKL
ncbi:MAG: hypothetical protein EOO61_01315 [Hymenobacter sp.]|nr:MAG: hypothetical protein EOO61_01315 [Hymenobacter sp.]